MEKKICCRNLDYSDGFTEEEEEVFLLELTRQMSYSTVENIICFKPSSTTKTYHHHRPISVDQNNTSNYKVVRGRINQTKARGRKQQMKQQQHVRKQQQGQDAAAAVWGEKINSRQPTKEAASAGANWRYPHHIQQQQHGIRRESTGTGVFLPRHLPDTRTTSTGFSDVDTKVDGGGQSNTATPAACYALWSHHQPKKFLHAEQPRSRDSDTDLRINGLEQQINGSEEEDLQEMIRRRPARNRARPMYLDVYGTRGGKAKLQS